MNLLTLLQSDLRALSVEAKKKYPAVKEAADRAIVKLRSLDEKTPVKELARSEEVVRPVLLALDEKNAYSAKLLSVAVPCLQKLLSSNAVPPEQLPAIVASLTALTAHHPSRTEGSGAVEDVNVKVLQALTTLVSCNAGLHGATIASALTISFHLHAHGGNAVRSTASATLPMIVSMIFDRAEIELGLRSAAAATGDDDGSVGVADLRGTAQDAAAIVSDLCALTSGEPGEFLTLTQLAPTFGLELIELLLSSHAALFRTAPIFRALLADKVCPLLIKAFHRLGDFPVCVRLVRLVGAFVARFGRSAPHECEVLLIRLCRLLDPEARDWQQVLALEALRPMLADPSLICAFYRNYDLRGQHRSAAAAAESAARAELHRNRTSIEAETGFRVYEDTVAAVGRVLQALFTSSSDCGFTLADSNPPARSRVLEHLLQAEPPQVKCSYRAALALSCLLAISSSLHDIVRSPKSYCADKSSTPPAEGKEEEEEEPLDIEELTRGLASSSWASLLGGLSAAFARTKDDGVLQTVLKAYENCVFVMGTAGLDVPRDAFLTSLCKFASHPDDGSAATAAAAATKKSLRESPQEAAERAAWESRKVLESVKSLMSVCHCHGSVLGSGWYIALQGVEAFGHHVPAHGSLELGSDMSIAALAFSSLFESTLHLDTESTLAMLTELTKLSLRSLAASDERPSPTLTPTTAIATVGEPESSTAAAQKRLGTTGNFYLDRVMETALLNYTRIDALWAPFHEHALAAAKSSSAAVRSFVIASLTELFLSALAPDAAAAGLGRKLICGPPLASPRQSIVAMEVPFIELFEELLTTTQFSDIRVALLESANKIVQSSGHAFTHAWPRVLSLLTSAARIGDKQACAVAFQTVQLISTDFLEDLPASPEDCLSKYIALAALYARQTDHVNISLSSSEILWNTASFVAKLLQKEKTADAPSEEEEAGKGEESEEKEETSANQERCRTLWLQIFTELRNLAIDERFDVRSSAASILFRALSTHAPLFDQQTWELCLWEVLFPMLDSVKLQARSVATADIPSTGAAASSPSLSSSQQSASVTAPKDPRSSPQKQWVQSMVMVIDGLCRLVKVTAEQQRDWTRFADSWEHVCSFVKDCAADLSAHEVAECSLNSLLLLLPRAAELKLPRELWDQCLSAVEAVVALVAARNPHRTTPQVLTAACTSISDTAVAHAASGFIGPNDAVRFADTVAQLPLLAIDDFVDESGMTALQKAALRLLETLGTLPPPACDDSVVEKLILLHASLTSRACTQLQRRSANIGAAPTAPGTHARLEERRGATLFVVGSAAASACAALFNAASTAPAVRAAVFEGATRSLGEAMLSRHRPLPQAAPLSHQQGAATLWKAALTAFNALLGKGLDAASNDAQAWSAVLETSADFLFPARESLSHAAIAAAAASALEVDQLDVMLVDSLVAGVINHGGSVPDVGPRLLQQLLDGGRMAARGRERLCRGCYHGMFELASCVHSRPEIVAHAAPLVVARAKDVLAQFLAEDRSSGGAPMQRSRLVEVQCVLRESRELQTTLDDSCASAATAAAGGGGGGGGSKRAHLLVLYPLLCESVTTPETEIKSELRDLLELVGREFLKC